MKHLSVLAVAISSGQVGFVLLHRAALVDWGTSYDAVKSSTALVGFVQQHINDLMPDIVVTEQCGAECRKGRRTKRLIEAVALIASHNPVLDVSIPRPRPYPTKFDEAAALAKRYPEVAGYVPARRRRFFDPEPRGMILFEALILAERIIYGPPDPLANAMG